MVECIVSALIAVLQVIPYWIAQHLGAFVASAVLYGVYVGQSACGVCTN